MARKEKETRKTRGIEGRKTRGITGSVMLGLAGQVIPLTVEFDVRTMAENIKRGFAISLTEEYIENVLLDILWRVHEENPDIVNRKIRTKSRGRITFELSFCPVPIQELSEDDFNRLLRLQCVNT